MTNLFILAVWFTNQTCVVEITNGGYGYAYKLERMVGTNGLGVDNIERYDPRTFVTNNLFLSEKVSTDRKHAIYRVVQFSPNE